MFMRGIINVHLSAPSLEGTVLFSSSLVQTEYCYSDHLNYFTKLTLHLFLAHDNRRLGIHYITIDRGTIIAV